MLKNKNDTKVISPITWSGKKIEIGNMMENVHIHTIAQYKKSIKKGTRKKSSFGFCTNWLETIFSKR